MNDPNSSHHDDPPSPHSRSLIILGNNKPSGFEKSHQEQTSDAAAQPWACENPLCLQPKFGELAKDGIDQTEYKDTFWGSDLITQPISCDEDGVKRYPKINSPDCVHLYGKVVVENSITSTSSIHVYGKLHVQSTLRSFGGLHVNGELTCLGDIKVCYYMTTHGCTTCWSDGTITVTGDLIIYGECNITGTVEVLGSVIVHDYLKCSSLKVRGSLSLIGSESRCVIEEEDEDFRTRKGSQDDIFKSELLTDRYFSSLSPR
ncbi:hypothetical protein F4810DRAFT_654986 [Camillea tinctor]|nr:hypothetical protein F4810DRAFT_654986 [Camillea tinctor]